MTQPHSVTDLILVAINNTQRWQTTYRGMARTILASNPGIDIPGHVYKSRIRFMLAEALRERFQDMTNDVRPLPVAEFPRDGDQHAERTEMVRTLIQAGLSEVNWSVLARELISEVQEEDRYAETNK